MYINKMKILVVFGLKNGGRAKMFSFPDTVCFSLNIFYLIELTISRSLFCISDFKRSILEKTVC